MNKAGENLNDMHMVGSNLMLFWMIEYNAGEMLKQKSHFGDVNVEKNIFEQHKHFYFTAFDFGLANISLCSSMFCFSVIKPGKIKPFRDKEHKNIKIVGRIVWS